MPSSPADRLAHALCDDQASLAQRVAWARQAMEQGVDPNAARPGTTPPRDVPLVALHSWAAFAVLVAPPPVLEVLLDAGAQPHPDIPESDVQRARAAAMRSRLLGARAPRCVDLLGRVVKEWVECAETFARLDPDPGRALLSELERYAQAAGVLCRRAADPRRPDPLSSTSPWERVLGYLDQAAIDHPSPRWPDALAPSTASLVQAMAPCHAGLSAGDLDALLHRHALAPWRPCVQQWRWKTAFPAAPTAPTSPRF